MKAALGAESGMAVEVSHRMPLPGSGFVATQPGAVPVRSRIEVFDARFRRYRRWLHLRLPRCRCAVRDAIIKGAALIVERRRSEVRVACINGRAAGQQFMGKGRAAVVLERAEHGLGVDLVAGRSQEAAAVIAAEIVAERGNRACIVRDVGARRAGLQDGIPDLEARRRQRYRRRCSMAELPLIVLFLMLPPPWMPPPELVAKLLLSVLLVIVITLRFEMPPP